MFTCKICGFEFFLHINNHYISRNGERTGLAAAIGPESESKLFDTFDCPECGCQNVIQERKRKYPEIDDLEQEESEEDV